MVTSVVLVLFRQHAFAAPLDADECNYAYIAGRVLDGDRLYVDVWDHQPPGIFAFLALVVSLFGDAPVVFRITACAATVVTLWLIYAAAHRSLNRFSAGLAAVLYAFSSSDPGISGEEGNREIYMNVLAVASFALLLPKRCSFDGRASGSPRMLAVCLAGLLMGLASTLKTVMAAPAVFLFAWLVWASFVNRGNTRTIDSPKSKGPGPPLKGWWWLPFGFVVGPIALWIGIAAYFAATERWTAFLDAVFTYNVDYSGLNRGLGHRFVYAFQSWTFSRTNLPLWVAALIGSAALPWRRNPAPSAGIAAMTLGSALAIALPSKPWLHYFQLLLPWATIVAAAPAGRRVQGSGFRVQGSPITTGITIGYAITLIIAVGSWQGYWHLSRDPTAISGIGYLGRDAWAREQGRRVATVTEAEDTIFVWGDDPGIYYYSARKCASRYTMVGALRGDDPAASDRRRILLDELQRLRPRLILISSAPVPKELDDYVRANYVAVGLDPDRMHVLCDPARPIAAIDWTWSGAPLKPGT